MIYVVICRLKVTINSFERSGDLNRKKLILILAITLGLIILAGGVGMTYTSQPSFCSNCHSMEKAYTAWTVGNHKGVDCISCHIDPGLANKVKLKLGGINQVYLTVTGNEPQVIKAEVPMRRCFSCHTKEQLVEKQPLHKSIVAEEGTSCASCHRNVIHPTK